MTRNLRNAGSEEVVSTLAYEGQVIENCTSDFVAVDGGSDYSFSLWVRTEVLR